MTVENNLNLYLAHPYNSKEEIRRWELDFEERTGITLVNPFFDVKDTPHLPEENAPSLIERMRQTKDRYKELVEAELNAIKENMGMVAIINGVETLGTYQEMVYAHSIFKMPVYTLVTNGWENHTWIKYHSTEIFTERKELEDFLIELQKSTD